MSDDSRSKGTVVSPWANHLIAPLEAAGAIVPIADSNRGPVFTPTCHGTAFFVTDDGMFLTARHVVEDFGNLRPPIAIFIFGGFTGVPGYAMLPVEFLTAHPTADIALGKATIESPVRVSPMTLSTRRLREHEPVAILGYPQSSCHYTLGASGEVLSSLKVTPDYFEGRVLEHHPTGICLARWPAYSTDIAPPPGHVKDLGGASGGPLVASDSLHVHGLLCSASEGYSVCTDIQEALDWDVFVSEQSGHLSIRALGRKYPERIRVV